MYSVSGGLLKRFDEFLQDNIQEVRLKTTYNFKEGHILRAVLVDAHWEAEESV